MESALCVTMQMALFKPLNRQFATSTQSAAMAKPLRLSYCAFPIPNPRSASSILLPLRCVSSSAASSGGAGGGDLSPLPPDAIVLRVEGMMCDGCANNVKKLLESRPQVSSASVNLNSAIAIVSAVSEEKAAPNWHKQLGEALAQHLTNCGFNSTLRVKGKMLLESVEMMKHVIKRTLFHRSMS